MIINDPGEVNNGGFESGVFSNNEGAWHGLGVVMPNKIYDTEQACKLGGLDWTVSKRPLYVQREQGEVEEIDTHKALVRDSDGFILNPCVSNRYEPLQNSDAFKFFEPFLHEKDCFISAAISINNGRKICLTAEIEQDIKEVVPGDPIRNYLVLAGSHDGSLSSSVFYSTIRPVCQNTLKSALANLFKEDKRKVKHTSNQLQALNSIQQSINLAKKTFDDDFKLYQQMAQKPMDLDATRAYLETLFEKELVDSAKRKEIPLSEMSLEQNRFTLKCLENFMFTPDLQMDGVAETGWAAFNAVTEAIKTRSSNPDNRLNSILFGQDSKLIERAKELVLTMN